MDRTQLGPLDVSQLALGAMLFGTVTREDVSFALLDQYVEAGGNFIDTSNNYAFWPEGGRSGVSEDLLGRWLKARGRRDDLVIATKVGAKPNRPGGGLEDIEGLGRDVIVREIEGSLRRLGTDHVDLYYAHVDYRPVPLEETLRGFEEVVKAGKVRAIGCSNTFAYRIAEARAISAANGLPSYCCVQQRHSYLRAQWRANFTHRDKMGEKGGIGLEDGMTVELLDYTSMHPEFRIVAYSPLVRGAYARPDKIDFNYTSPENVERMATLRAVAAEAGATPGQTVLAWMLQSTPQIIPLMAVSNAAQLDENAGALGVTLSAAQLERLDKVA